MKLFRIPLTLLLLALFSCSCNQLEKSAALPISWPEATLHPRDIKLSEIARDIEFIQLETNKETLINVETSECQMAGPYILVISRKPCGVLLFDRSGKFLRRIGQVGQGPNEYTYVDAGCMDPGGQFVYLTDPFSNRFFKYSISGEVLTSEPFSQYSRFLDFGKVRMVFIDTDHMALTPVGRGTSFKEHWDMLIIDKDLRVTDSIGQVAENKDDSYNYVNHGEISSSADGVIYYRPVLGTVEYLNSNGRITAHYQINLGRKISKYNEINNYSDFLNPPYRVLSTRDLPGFLQISGLDPDNHFQSIVFNKKTGETFMLESKYICHGLEGTFLPGFTDDLAGIPIPPLMEVNYFEKEIFGWFDTQGDIDDQLECIRNMDVKLPERRDQLIKMGRGRPGGENPMIVILKMK